MSLFRRLRLLLLMMMMLLLIKMMVMAKIMDQQSCQGQ